MSDDMHARLRTVADETAQRTTPPPAAAIRSQLTHRRQRRAGTAVVAGAAAVLLLVRGHGPSQALQPVNPSTPTPTTSVSTPATPTSSPPTSGAPHRLSLPADAPHTATPSDPEFADYMVFRDRAGNQVSPSVVGAADNAAYVVAGEWLLRLDEHKRVVAARRLLTPGATAIAASMTDVWVGYESGRVEVRDPYTLRVDHAFRAPAVTGLTLGADGVWVQSDSLLEWRRTDGLSQGTWPISAQQIAFAGNAAWIAVNQPYQADKATYGLRRIDLRTRAVTRIRVPGYPVGVAAANDSLIVSSTAITGADNVLALLDARTGKVVRSRPAHAAGDVAIARGLAWILGDVTADYSGQAQAFDLTTLAPRRETAFPTVSSNGCAHAVAGPGGAWGINQYIGMMCRFDF